MYISSHTNQSYLNGRVWNHSIKYFRGPLFESSVDISWLYFIRNQFEANNTTFLYIITYICNFHVVVMKSILGFCGVVSMESKYLLRNGLDSLNEVIQLKNPLWPTAWSDWSRWLSSKLIWLPSINWFNPIRRSLHLTRESEYV